MRRKRRRQKKISIILFLSLLILITVGYAAFQTNLSLTAKGNIKELTAAEYLRKKCNQTNGDGLYKDIYEEGKCIYKGANPNNYIKFNNELWRIISVETDGTLKIIKNEIIGYMPFDSKSLRPTGYCSKGSAITQGCNVWASIDNFSNDNYSGEVSKDAELNIYLNTSYLSGLYDYDKIVLGVYYIGSVLYNNSDLSSQIASEKKYTWNGKVGLITVSEYLKANSNQNQCGNFNLNNTNSSICLTSNWLFQLVPLNKYLWTISPNSKTTDGMHDIHYDGKIGGQSGSSASNIENYGVAPVVYLNSNIILSNSGTLQNPYQIKKSIKSNLYTVPH